MEKRLILSGDFVDFGSLRRADAKQLETTVRLTAPPTNYTEELLLVFWQDLFNSTAIGIHDEFFMLGGYSLLATRMAARVKQALGVELTLRQIFTAPTIAELAVEIDKMRAVEQRSAAQAIKIVLRAGALPLSFAEERMWFLALMQPDIPIYNIAFHFRLVDLDVAALEKSYAALASRQEIMRTTFKLVDGEPMREIAPELHVTLPVIDLTELDDEQVEAEVERLFLEASQRKFDLEQGPLFRGLVVKLANNRFLHLCVVHHIITDGWSLHTQIVELAALYAQIAQGVTPALPELAVQYSDYALWQRQSFAGAEFQRQLSYWQKQLGGDLPTLSLPTDFPRPTTQTYAGAEYNVVIPQQLTNALNALSRREGVTLYVTLLAALNVLFYHYSEQEDIIIGSPVANRHNVELDNLLGFFVNTLALRCDLSGAPTFSELLRRLLSVAISAWDNQDLPFEKIVREINVERDLSHSPIFQVMFALHNLPQTMSVAGGQAEYGRSFNNGTTQFDLFLHVVETANTLRINVEYNSALFQPTTIERMLHHFEVLLQATVNNPARRITDLAIMDADEQEQILVGWNATERDYPLAQRLHTLFDERAARTPERNALVFANEQLSYSELSARANQLGHLLRGKGVGVGDVVGLCVEPSFEMVIGMLAVLKTGAAYLPLDPTYPRERLLFMLRDAGAKIALTQQQTSGILAEESVERLAIDTPDLLAGQPTTAPEVDLNADAVAYVLYTSGSTGTPKGIQGLHKGMVNRLAWMWETYPFAEGEVACAKTSISFVDSVAEIFGPLLHGVPLVIATKKTLLDVREFVRFLAEQRVSRLTLVPSLLKAMLEQHEKLGQTLPSLKMIVCSGERLGEDLAVRLCRAAPEVKLLNLYGSSEVSADATFYEAQPGQEVLIGRPIANTQVYILNERRAPVPVGAPGELYVGGVGLAGGYVNNPELSAEKFIDSPWGRLYKTGDVARFKPDGNIEYLGRRDFQVKIRGFRVELDEVASALRRYPAVQQAVVTTGADRAGYNTLAAYFVASQDLDSATLQRFLRQSLPDFMVPTFFMQLDHLPLLPNGKLNRSALPAPQTEENADTDNAPRDELEQKLVQLWEEVLEVRQPGIHEDFFDLGGHSLLAVRLFSRIEAQLGVSAQLSKLFQAPTIAGLAEAIRHPEQKRSLLVPMYTKGTRPPLFLIHPLSGTVMIYQRLALHLSPYQPVYGLEASGFLPGEPLPTGIEAMAQEYIQEIRAVQPNGPYHLAGYSLGGYIALEMAQQLRASGEETRFLGLIDPLLFVDISQSEHDMYMEQMRYWTGKHLEKLKDLSLKEKLAYIGKKGKARRQFMQTRRNSKAEANKTEQPEPELDSEMQRRIDLVIRTLDAASTKYRPAPYSGPITYFRAEIPLNDRPTQPYQAWQQLAHGSFDLHMVPGDHNTMVREPNVREMARAFRQCLEQLAAEENTSHEPEKNQSPALVAAL